jgi:hypothetical protein
MQWEQLFGIYFAWRPREGLSFHRIPDICTRNRAMMQFKR